MNTTDIDIEHSLKTGENNAALRRHFGSTLYEVLREEATGPAAAFSSGARPKVYLLPGILGSTLEARNWLGHDLVWVDALELLFGGVRRLRLSPDDGVRPAGLLDRSYLRMKTRLPRLGINVQELPYDWRKGTSEEATRLMARLRSENAGPVMLVCHSMGGLVARGMAGLDPTGSIIDRVITIGTPNLGSYAPVQVFMQDHGFLDLFAVADQVHTSEEIVERYMRHFPGLVEMMPGYGHGPFDLFDRTAWPHKSTIPTQQVLDRSLATKSSLPPPDHRFTQIISDSEETVVDARVSASGLDYVIRKDGDGTVPRALAEFGAAQRYYTHGVHPWLCTQDYIIDAVRDLVLTGSISDRANFSTRPGSRFPDANPELAVYESNSTGDTPTEADFLESFATPSLPNPTAAPVALSQTEDAGEALGPHGYVLDHMRQAGAAWRAAADERAEIARHVAKGMSTLAETPERLEKYERRIMDAAGSKAFAVLDALGDDTSVSSPIDMLRERIIGSAEQFMSVDFLKRGGHALKPVCRIVRMAGMKGFGTGFLVAPDVIMTNNHVLPSASAARRAGAQFEFERDVHGQNMNGRVVTLDPGRLFLTDPHLDFTLIAVTESATPPHRDYGYLPLIAQEGKIRITRPVNIIQHPDARRKEVVVRESTLKIFPPTRLDFAHYTGDTLPGSSGSPVLNDRWEVVALHHSGVPKMDARGQFLTIDGTPWNRTTDPKGRMIDWEANEGVRVSRIMPKVAEAEADITRPARQRAMLESVLEAGTRASAEGAFFWLDEASSAEAQPDNIAVVDTPQPPQTISVADPGASIDLPLTLTVNLTPSEAAGASSATLCTNIHQP